MDNSMRTPVFFQRSHKKIDFYLIVFGLIGVAQSKFIHVGMFIL